MATVTLDMTGDEARALRALGKVVDKNSQLEQQLRKVNQAAKSAGKDHEEVFGSRAVAQLGAYAAGVLSINAAISQAAQTWRVYQQNMREAGKQTEDLSRGVVPFASIQPAGTRAQRVQEVQQLATRFGFKDRQQVFDTVQMLQSMPGMDYQKALAGTEQILRANLVGMKVESAKELVVQARQLGMEPQEAINFAQITGEISEREPETIAKGAMGLPFFRRDKVMAFAAAGTLAGPAGNELETYLKAGGKVLESGNFGKEQIAALRRMTGGLSEKDIRELSQMDVLQIYNAEFAGRKAELKDVYGLGVQDVRESTSLMIMLNNFGQMQRYMREIPARAADPRMLEKKREELETELPFLRLQREIDTGEARGKELQAFGPGMESQFVAREEQARAIALRKMGQEQFLGFDLIDEQGRTSWWQDKIARLSLRMQDFMRNPYDTYFGESYEKGIRREREALEKPIGGMEEAELLRPAGPPVEALEESGGGVGAVGIKEAIREGMRELVETISVPARELMRAAERMQGTPMRVGREADR